MDINFSLGKKLAVGMLSISTLLVSACSDDAVPAGPTELESFYFTAHTKNSGQELWKTDGTETGTVMVKEINSTGDSNPANYVVAGGNVFFVADDNVHGRELWIKPVDGDAQLVDINPAAIAPEEDSSSDIANMTAHGDRVFFTADDSVNGNELWVSDGTVSGTKMVVDLTGDDVSSNITWLTSKPGGDLYFLLNGNSLYRSNGTAAGTTLVSTDPFGSATNLIAVGDKLFFHANNNQLWMSDGNTASMLQTVGYASSSYSHFMSLGDKLLFRLGSYWDGTLWVSDGSAEGTFRLKSVEGLTVYPYATYPYSGIVQAGNVAYFVNYSGPGEIYQLWKTDGTDGGTVQVTDGVYNPRLLAAASDGRLMFHYNGSLWSSDGTDAGTQDLLTDSPSVCASTASTFLCFLSDDDKESGYELWQSDGSFDGTVKVPGVRTNQYVSAYGSQFYALGKDLYFAFDDNEHGRELWVSDGTEGGSKMLADVNTLPSNSAYPWIYLADNVKGTRSDENNQYQKISIRNNLFFIARDGRHGEGLWKTDGTETGTVLVKDINPNGNDRVGRMFKVGDRLYFTATDGEHGRELWVTDGTEAGTSMVFDGNPGSADGYPRPLANLNGKLLFKFDLSLWITDGTSVGTDIVDVAIDPRKVFVVGDKAMIFDNWSESIIVTDGTFEGTLTIDSDKDDGPYTYGISNYAILDDMAYFPAFDRIGSLRLWKSDGTLEGTNIVKKINMFDNDVYDGRQSMIVYNNAVYFVAQTPENGYELWKSDGTEDGTVMVNDIAVDGFSSYPEEFNIVNDSLIFKADDGIHGYELWVTNGTAEGTSMLKEISVDNPDSEIYYYYRLGNYLYFSANDFVHGRELWRTDGTTDGTLMLKDIFEGESTSWPSAFMSYGDLLYFSANDGVHGTELWVTDGTTDGTRLLKDIYEGEEGRASAISDDD